MRTRSAIVDVIKSCIILPSYHGDGGVTSAMGNCDCDGTPAPALTSSHIYTVDKLSIWKYRVSYVCDEPFIHRRGSTTLSFWSTCTDSRKWMKTMLSLGPGPGSNWRDRMCCTCGRERGRRAVVCIKCMCHCDQMSRSAWGGTNTVGEGRRGRRRGTDTVFPYGSV